MIGMDNYYDSGTGEWVTAWDRYRAVAGAPPFNVLDDPLIIADQPELAWRLLLNLIRAVPEDTVECVGAGPLETFVTTHGAAFIDELENEARINPRFLQAG